MADITKIAGSNGCERQSGSGTITAPNGKKIWAIGIEAAANITNYKYTPKLANGRDGSQVTYTGKAWMGTALAVSGATALIPLDHLADSVTVASGDVWAYFI